jgi:nucleotide-binding universal stress UspA family protein
MKHVLVPIDGSTRSIEAVQAIENFFPPEQADVTLLLVREDVDSRIKVILDEMTKQSMHLLDQAAALIPCYKVEKVVEFGIPGSVILKYAKLHDTSVIMITKRTNTALSILLGSVATHLVKFAHCPVIVLPEAQLTT